MANQYFVYEGLQFTTITVAGNTFARDLSNNHEAVTLESVVTALGTNVVANLSALEAFWSNTGANDIFQKAIRSNVRESSNLISPRTDDIGGGVAGQLHKTSHVYILPPGLSMGMTALPDSAATSDAEDARKRMAIKFLEVRHDGIAKHDTTTAAWQAWIDYIVATEGDGDLEAAQARYLARSN